MKEAVVSNKNLYHVALNLEFEHLMLIQNRSVSDVSHLDKVNVQRAAYAKHRANRAQSWRLDGRQNVSGLDYLAIWRKLKIAIHSAAHADISLNFWGVSFLGFPSLSVSLSLFSSSSYLLVSILFSLFCVYFCVSFPSLFTFSCSPFFFLFIFFFSFFHFFLLRFSFSSFLSFWFSSVFLFLWSLILWFFIWFPCFPVSSFLFFLSKFHFLILLFFPFLFLKVFPFFVSYIFRLFLLCVERMLFIKLLCSELTCTPAWSCILQILECIHVLHAQAIRSGSENTTMCISIWYMPQPPETLVC